MSETIPAPRFDLIEVTNEDEFAASFPVLQQLSMIETPEVASTLTIKKSWAQFVAAYKQGYRLYIAQGTTEVLGAVGLRICHDPLNDGKPYGVINNLVVEEDYRGIGIGRDILDRVEAIAKREKATHTIIAVLTSNKKTKQLYEELGYSTVSHLMIKEI